MRIGILTFQFADNYGALLQAYALKKYISKSGTQAEIINYANKRLSESYNIHASNSNNILKNIKSLIFYPIRSSQANLFEKFRKEKLHISNPKDTSTELRKDFDCYIVGSDQVWNSKITYNDYNYFLAHISSPNVKKISYAASADDDFLMDSDYENKIELLKQFNAISVRESHMSDILRIKAFIDSEVVLDPVFLLSPSEWADIAKQPKIKTHKKFILYYTLKKNEKLDELARRLSRKIQAPIIIVHPTLRKISTLGFPALNIGPEEFIWLIKNAEFIVSNSFHAFSFAYIFEKRIYFDFIKGSSNRIENLISMLDLQEMQENSAKYIDMNNCNDKIFKSWLKISTEFIKRNITDIIG